MSQFFHGFIDEILKLSADADAKGKLSAKYNVELLGNWYDEELHELNNVLSKLPDKLVRNNGNLLSVGRAPKILNAPPSAPGHSMYKPNVQKHGKSRGSLVIFDKGVYDRQGNLDSKLFGKSILHELSHSFDVRIPEVFGKPPFITDYACRSPEEDWAESFAEHFLNQEILKNRAPAKAKAIALFLGG
jgi:hypothetical protein